MRYELESMMAKNLVKIASNVEEKDISKAADLISSASEIFDNCGMFKQSDKLINLLKKIAKKDKENTFLSEFDSVCDDEGIDELLAADIGEGINKEKDIQTDFEDE